jgi:hypothetical protein
LRSAVRVAPFLDQTPLYTMASDRLQYACSFQAPPFSLRRCSVPVLELVVAAQLHRVRCGHSESVMWTIPEHVLLGVWSVSCRTLQAPAASLSDDRGTLRIVYLASFPTLRAKRLALAPSRVSSTTATSDALLPSAVAKKKSRAGGELMAAVGDMAVSSSVGMVLGAFISLIVDSALWEVRSKLGLKGLEFWVEVCDVLRTPLLS